MHVFAENGKWACKKEYISSMSIVEPPSITTFHKHKWPLVCDAKCDLIWDNVHWWISFQWLGNPKRYRQGYQRQTFQKLKRFWPKYAKTFTFIFNYRGKRMVALYSQLAMRHSQLPVAFLAEHFCQQGSLWNHMVFTACLRRMFTREKNYLAFNSLQLRMNAIAIKIPTDIYFRESYHFPIHLHQRSTLNPEKVYVIE